MKRILTGGLAVLVVVLTGILSAQPAAASDALVASDPAPREQLEAPPGGVTLAFDHEVEFDSVKVLVLDPQGRNVVVGDLDYFGSTVALLLQPDLPRGTYTVRYRLPGAGGEPEGGAFQFSIGPGRWTDPLPDESWSGTDQQPPDLANPDPQATEPAETPGAEETPGIDLGEPGETPTPSAAETVTPTPGATGAATVQPTPPAGGDGGSQWWPWLVGGLVVLAAAGVGGWLVVRNRRG